MFPSVYSTIKMSFSLTNNDRLLSPSIHLGSIHEIYNIPMKDINCPFPSIVDEIKSNHLSKLFKGKLIFYLIKLFNHLVNEI
ncbi:unnamed protein product [Rotaria sp. Silwood1]|nr:unnamed protein product [Rotaria sp. Silwood1]